MTTQWHFVLTLHCSYQYPTLWYSTEQQKMLLPFHFITAWSLQYVRPIDEKKRTGCRFIPSSLVGRATFCSIGCDALHSWTRRWTILPTNGYTIRTDTLVWCWQNVHLGLFQNNQCKEYVHNRPQHWCSSWSVRKTTHQDWSCIQHVIESDCFCRFLPRLLPDKDAMLSSR